MILPALCPIPLSCSTTGNACCTWCGYLKTVSIRVQRGLTDLEKDRSRQGQVAPFLDALNRMLTSMDATTSVEKRDAVETYFWMIEEYKVSLFAQEVGTDGPISAKRLNKLMGEIERMI